jgi:hypothetical protein
MVLQERFHLFSRLHTIGWNQNFEIRCDIPENLFSGMHDRGNTIQVGQFKKF